MFNEKDQRMGKGRDDGDDDDDDDKSFDGDFMELLGCDHQSIAQEKRGDQNINRVHEFEEGFLFSPPYSSSNMLHFGGGHEELLLFNNGVNGDGSLATKGRSKPRSTKRVENNGGGKRAAAITSTVAASCRKPKAGSTGNIKARNDKLGERISALQHLVSPFGKSDTATVLHEAIGYIRFLHDQIQVLSSPYLQQCEEQGEGDLRSRGLCLVPVSYTGNVASNNRIGADIWSPAAAPPKLGSKH